MQNNPEVNDLTIRNANEFDLEDIYSIEIISSINPWSKKIFEQELKSSNSINLVLCLPSTKIVSYIFSWFYDNELEIQNIATAPGFRKKGYAKNLIQATIDNALLKTNHLKAFLEVRATNMAAIELYRKFGFEVEFIRKKYYENQENALQMYAEFNNIQ